MTDRSTDRRDPSNAVRIGARTHPLSDLYYRLLQAAWWQVLIFFAACYLVANLTFASLYVTCGDCVEGVRPGHFADAFFFSVQTISTIGYGHLYPQTNFASALVTVESLVGLFGFAVVTGIVFSKFSRPRARVMFSRPALFSRHNGEPALLFRLANARGNDIVEASIRVAVLLPETTAEGHDIRRLHDVELSRDRSPLFTLSWLVIHIIDESSPLYGLDEDKIRAEGAVLIVSLTGIDGTFHDIVHARHIYRPSAMRWGVAFEDVIGTAEDGRVLLDLTKFHETKPLPPAQSTSP